jgi:two-component system chemotaxis response regulator CheY
MRKPLILLVDDDRGVLDAVEAAIAPAFEEIARIEVFDRPEDVLAAIPRWTEETRPIAVAVVDQKMPGISGGELLKRLRDQALSAQSQGMFHPAAHVHAILLTGYAGLVSALFAKNEAGVDRYLAKPWKVDTLRGHARSLFVRHVAETAQGAFLTVHAAETEPALNALLSCRNQIARYGGAGPAAVARPALQEFDAYDLRAHHLAITVVQDSAPMMIGCVRVVVDGEGPLSEHLRDKITASAEIRRGLEQAASTPFPVVTQHPEGRALDDLCRRLTARGEHLVEASVPILAASFGSFETVRHTARSTVAYCSQALGASRALVPSPAICRPLYEELGFRSVPSEVPRARPACLLGDPSSIPLKERTTLEILGSRLATTGDACICPSYPGCLPAPYVTGEFSGVDVFCPRRFRAWNTEQAES